MSGLALLDVSGRWEGAGCSPRERKPRSQRARGSQLRSYPTQGAIGGAPEQQSGKYPSGGSNGVRRLLRVLQAAALARTAAEAEEEVATKTIKLQPSRIVDPERDVSADGSEAADKNTADDFFRDWGASAPGLIAASVINSVFAAFGQTEEGQARSPRPTTGKRRSPADEDWSHFAKYDVFRELLSTSPLLKEERFRPIRALLNASPRRGEGKHDFIAALLRTLSSEPTGSHKWDLVHEILQRSKQDAQSAATKGLPEQLRKYDIVHSLLHESMISADWGLPTSGLAHDLLRFDEWGARDADPLASLLEAAWHGNVKPAWDPLVAAFNATAPTTRASWDPLQAILRSKVPGRRVSGRAEDPIEALFAALQLERQGESKYNPLPALFAAEAPTEAISNPVGDAIHWLKRLDPRGTPDMVSDVLKGLATISDPGRVTKYLPQLPGGLGSKDSSKSPASPSQRGIRALQAAKPFTDGRSKYDPVPGMLAAAAPRGRADHPLAGVLQASGPKGMSRYDPVPDLLALQEPRPATGRLDVLRALFKAGQRLGAEGYDPMLGSAAVEARSRLSATPDAAVESSQGGQTARKGFAGRSAQQSMDASSTATTREAKTEPPATGLLEDALSRRARAVSGQTQPATAQLSESACVSSPDEISGQQPGSLLEDALARRARDISDQAQPAMGQLNEAAGASSPDKTPGQEPGSLLEDALARRSRNLSGQAEPPSRTFSTSPRREVQSSEQPDAASSTSQDTTGPSQSKPLQGAAAGKASRDALARRVQSLEQRWRQLSEQSEQLRLKFGQGSSLQKGGSQPPKHVQPQPKLDSQQEQHARSEALGLQRQAEALRRQIASAGTAPRENSVRTDSKENEEKPEAHRDLVPDILRLQGALLARPIAGRHDPFEVLRRRGGAARMHAIATAVRAFRKDARLGEKQSPFRRLMLGGGAPRPSDRDVRAAESGSALLAELRDNRAYSPLAALLLGREPDTVVGAIRALNELIEASESSS